MWGGGVISFSFFFFLGVQIIIMNNIIIIMILLSEMENSFLPNWSWARQPLSSARSTLLYPFQMLNAKQGSSNSHLLTSFGMTRPGIEPTTSRLWGGRSTDWANTHRCIHAHNNHIHKLEFNQDWNKSSHFFGLRIATYPQVYNK